jgi:hypothetical protein
MDECEAETFGSCPAEQGHDLRDEFSGHCVPPGLGGLIAGRAGVAG